MSDKTTPKTSVSPADEEPKQSSAKTAGAKPGPAKMAHNAVIGAGETDYIKYSSAKPSTRKKVLTVLHIQRRLADEGHAEAASSPGGTYDVLTRRAVADWQKARKEEPTGILTREQFEALFQGDPNVTVHIDTHEDHPPF